MLDIKWIRENAEEFDKIMTRRRSDISSSSVLSLDEKRREVIQELQELQNRRNVLSKKVGEAKAKAKGEGDDAVQAIFAEMKEVGPKTKALQEVERQAIADVETLVSTIPNLLADDTPEGKDDSDNVEIRKWGEPKKFDFEPQAHYDLGEELGYLDFATAGKIAGARFVWQSGDLARMERALASFMLDTHAKSGFTEVIPPLLLKTETMYGTAQLPKFEDDQFQTTDGRWMLPTAEVPLTNYMSDKTIAESELPLKFCAGTYSFRKEAGSAGRDTRGLIRMHQFFKVEMVQIVHPEKSWEALDFMLNCAETILQKLQLPYRVVDLCDGDISFTALKTYDLEVWVPAQNVYREISSCSNCGDFQARRMNGKFKDKATGKNRFVHTLNGSGLATGRTLVAVMENYQQADGSIIIPEVLRPYMGGQEIITATEYATKDLMPDGKSEGKSSCDAGDIKSAS